MAVANRALTGPININNDHSDSMGSRDSGWIQIYSENAQEAYDNMLMAHRIAEDSRVRLPLMVCMDGFITSHAVQNLTLEDDADARAFAGVYRPEIRLLNPSQPAAYGPYGISAYYMELKKTQTEAMRAALTVIQEVSDAYAKLTGRQYGLIESYRMEDAELAAVLIGSSAGTGKDAVDELRGKGIRAGLVKIRSFRPFPAEAVAEALKGVKAVAVMDKDDSFSACGGPLGAEVRSAMYCAGLRAPALNIVYGLGGRDVRLEDFRTVFGLLQKAADGESAERFTYIGVRE
jgi:pyruvate ferredoxin oxidoreductase alpha subunit